MNNPETREALITEYSRMVILVASQFQHTGLSFIELINIGNLGLTEAAKRFDESGGYEFKNYAIWFIRQSLIQAIMEKEIKKPIPLNKIGLLTWTPSTILRPGHILLREPARKEMEWIEKFHEKLQISKAQAERSYSHVLGF